MEETKGILENYIKKGLEKGFNINYIKDTLKKHGHSDVNIDGAANNVMGMKYPDELKPHLEEVRQETVSYSSKKPIWLYVIIIILILIAGFFAVNYIINQNQASKVQTQIEEIEELGLDIDDLSSAVKTQLDLVKEKDLTIEEKEKIIEEQIDTMEEINNKIEAQQTKLKSLLLDIMNRMIGRMSE
jgi:DNA-binding transcriptional MerR regulator